jgi:hypothetical protein
MTREQLERAVMALIDWAMTLGDQDRDGEEWCHLANIRNEIEASETSELCDECGDPSIGHDEDGFPLCQSCGDKRVANATSEGETPAETDEPKCLKCGKAIDVGEHYWVAPRGDYHKRCLTPEGETSESSDEEVEDMSSALELAGTSGHMPTRYRQIARAALRLQREAVEKALREAECRECLCLEQARSDAERRAERAEKSRDTWKERYEKASRLAGQIQISKTEMETERDEAIAQKKLALAARDSFSDDFDALSNKYDDLDKKLHEQIEMNRNAEVQWDRLAGYLGCQAGDVVLRVKDIVFERGNAVARSHQLKKEIERWTDRVKTLEKRCRRAEAVLRGEK